MKSERRFKTPAALMCLGFAVQLVAGVLTALGAGLSSLPLTVLLLVGNALLTLGFALVSGKKCAGPLVFAGLGLFAAAVSFSVVSTALQPMGELALLSPFYILLALQAVAAILAILVGVGLKGRPNHALLAFSVLGALLGVVVLVSLVFDTLNNGVLSLPVIFRSSAPELLFGVSMLLVFSPMIGFVLADNAEKKAKR